MILSSMILLTQSAYLGHGHGTDSRNGAEARPHLHLSAVSHHHHGHHGHVHHGPAPGTTPGGAAWRSFVTHEDDALYVVANIVLRPENAAVLIDFGLALQSMAMKHDLIAPSETAAAFVLNRPPPLPRRCPLYTQLCTWVI